MTSQKDDGRPTAMDRPRTESPTSSNITSARAPGNGRDTIEEIKRLVSIHDHLGTGKSGDLLIRCPLSGHDDHNPSFSIHAGGRAFKCHGCGAGGDVLTLHHLLKGRTGKVNGETIGELKEMVGIRADIRTTDSSTQRKARPPRTYGSLELAIKAAETSVRRKWKSQCHTTLRHEYRNEDRASVGYMLRIENDTGGKTYRPVHPADGGWRVGDPPRGFPLYQLPRLLTATGVVFVVEGEKCVDAAAALGLNATTCAHGAKSPHRTDWTPLAGREVVILPDNDEAGQAFALNVASLLAKADPDTVVRIVDLPDLPEKGDIVDYIRLRQEDHGETPGKIREGIDALARETPAWERSPDGRSETSPENALLGGRPAIDVDVLANAFADRNRDDDELLRLWKHNGAWYRYDGVAYTHLRDDDVKGDVMRFLRSRVKEEKEIDPKSKLNASRYTRDGIIVNLESADLCFLPSVLRPPCWLPDGSDATGWLPMENTLVNVPNLARRLAGDEVNVLAALRAYEVPVDREARPQYLDTAEFARRVKRSTISVRRWIKKGVITSRLVMGRHMIPAGELDRMLGEEGGDR